jgi:quinohemoprotein ethanol dehydrogenase
VYTFTLNGKAKLPEFPVPAPKPLVSGVSSQVKSTADIQHGTKLYLNYCYMCHGIPASSTGGRIPNLGYSPKDVIQNLAAYVLEGALMNRGMPNFKSRLSEADVEKIKAFIQVSADQAKQKMTNPTK